LDFIASIKRGALPSALDFVLYRQHQIPVRVCVLKPRKGSTRKWINAENALCTTAVLKQIMFEPFFQSSKTLLLKGIKKPRLKRGFP